MSNSPQTICCLNPKCDEPENDIRDQLCRSCGSPLGKLRNRYLPTELMPDEGGFGRIYKALDLDNFGSVCVIKQLVPKLEGRSRSSVDFEKIRDLFEREALQLLRLGEHPKIPRLFAYFDEGGYFYLVQQFIDGEPLHRVCADRVWTENEVKIFLLEMLEILMFVHRNSVIHRDIKPSNVLRRRQDGKFILIDFGVCREVLESVVFDEIVGSAITGTTIGTFGYAPYEQMLEAKTYFASDLYSLGATCFFLLTKQPLNKIVGKKGYDWHQQWRSYLPAGQDVSPKFERVLDKLLQVDYRDRWKNAGEVLQLVSKSRYAAALKTSPFLVNELGYPVSGEQAAGQQDFEITEPTIKVVGGGVSDENATTLPPTVKLVDEYGNVLKMPEPDGERVNSIPEVPPTIESPPPTNIPPENGSEAEIYGGDQGLAEVKQPDVSSTIPPTPLPTPSPLPERGKYQATPVPTVPSPPPEQHGQNRKQRGRNRIFASPPAPTVPSPKPRKKKSSKKPKSTSKKNGGVSRRFALRFLGLGGIGAATAYALKDFRPQSLFPEPAPEPLPDVDALSDLGKVEPTSIPLEEPDVQVASGAMNEPVVETPAPEVTQPVSVESEPQPTPSPQPAPTPKPAPSPQPSPSPTPTPQPAQPKAAPKPEPVVEKSYPGETQFSYRTVQLNSKGEISGWVTKKAWQTIEDLGGGVKLEMVRLPTGSFMMGSPGSDSQAEDDEFPQHRVNINREIYIGKYQVTQRQWKRLINGDNPSRFKGENFPVERVSWEDTKKFIDQLNYRSSRTYRLPSEAEWEYACRAVTSHTASSTKYYFGNDSSILGTYAWYRDNSGSQTHSVGQKTPNQFGLCDMHGNVLEWCEDDYVNNYNSARNQSPFYSSLASDKVLRGGSWFFAPRVCRSAYRYDLLRDFRYGSFGFRVVCSLPG